MPRRRLLSVATSPRNGLRRLVEDFLAHKSGGGRSPKTIEKYDVVLNRVFLPWCEGIGITEPAQLDQRTLDQFNTDMLRLPSEITGRPRARASASSYARHVRGFLHWAQGERLVAGGIEVQRVAVPRKVLNTLERDEIAELEAAASTERDKLIIRILGDGGLRLSELLALTPQSLVEAGRDRFLRIQGKGSRERLVPLRPALWTRIKRYAERGRPAEVYTDRIFISLRKRDGVYEPLKPLAVERMMAAVGAKAGITKPVNPHALRHSMATNALRRRINPLQLARILGHSGLSMIETTYEHLVMSDDAAALMQVLLD